MLKLDQNERVRNTFLTVRNKSLKLVSFLALQQKIMMLLFRSLFFHPSVINPFQRERTLWQMGYLSCSCPPTLIAATHPYRPGGHMCCAPPRRSARKGHGDTPGLFPTCQTQALSLLKTINPVFLHTVPLPSWHLRFLIWSWQEAMVSRFNHREIFNIRKER